MKMDHKPRPLGPFGCYLFATAIYGTETRSAVFRAFKKNEGMIYTLFTPFEGERLMGVWNSNATSKRNMIEGEAIRDKRYGHWKIND